MKQLNDKEYEEFQQYRYNMAHGYIWMPDALDIICRGNNNDAEEIGKQMLQMWGKLQNERISHMTNDRNRKYVIRCIPQGRNETTEGFSL